MARLRVGDVLSAERTFTEAEVAAFVAISGDKGKHHLERDARGRLMVHGLLTATIPTGIGGSLNYLAREMVFEFLKPVWVGEAIRCELTITEAVDEPGRQRLAMTVSLKNPEGREVMRGSSRGVILDG